MAAAAAAATERARATVHDDRLERQGPAFLWTRERALPAPGAFVVGEVAWQTPDGYAPVERDADASAPPTAAPAGQHSTQILVTKTKAGDYAIAINGETVEPDAKRKVYLTNFQGPFTIDALDKTVVGPVTIGLLAETGQRPPSNATVTIAQRAYTNGAWLEEDVLQAADLPCGSEQSATLPTVSVPFPARFTQAPFIEIQNVKAEREKQAKALEKFFYKFVVMLLSFLFTLGLGWVGVLGSTTVGAGLNLARQATIGQFRSVFNLTEATTKGRMFEAYTKLLPILTPLLNVLGFASATSFADVVNTASKTQKKYKGRDAAGAAFKKYQTVSEGVVERIPQPFASTEILTTKTYRKYTVGGLTKTLKTLMAIDKASNDGENVDKVTLEDTRRFAKNEAILLEYLLEDFDPNGYLNWFSSALQGLNLGLMGQQKDATGEAQEGLLFAMVGTPRTRGLSADTLRTDFVTTAIDICITDASFVWRVRIEATKGVGFRAGYYSSGVSDDIRELQATIDEFSDVHCQPGDKKKVAHTKVSRYMRAQMNRVYELGRTLYRNEENEENEKKEKQAEGDEATVKLKPVSYTETKRKLLAEATAATHANLCQGADKLWNLLYPRLETLERDGLVGTDDPPLEPGTIVRLRPQRVRAKLVAYNSAPIDKVGISAVADNQDEFLHVFPIDAAHVSAARSLRQYGVAMRTLWALWEARTETRMLWYDAFAPRDALPGPRYDRSIGARHTPFVSTGAFFPLAIRDRLEGCSHDYYRPELAHAVEWIATKPATTFRGTKAERAQARATEANGATIQPTTPATLSEMVAVHVVADALIARTVARSALPAHVRVSSNPTASLRAMLPRVLQVVEACSVDPTQQGVARGVLSENDPLFVCMPGGADAARLLRYLGAWARRKDVSLAVGEPHAHFGVDRTQLQHTALHNLWPAEAATQLQSTMRALGNAATLSLASMPVYALQNTLAVTLDEDARHANAKLAEAVASFERTLAMGEALGINGLASNAVRLQLAAHWPVVLSAILSAESDGAARARIAQLPVLAPLDPPLPPTMTDDDVAMMRRRNASLRIDAQHFAQEPAFDGKWERANDAREYFVPFAHGFTPHSHVWSLEHPGSRAIDSVPVRCAFLQSALRECARVETGNDVVTVRCTEANYDHPFGVRVDFSDRINSKVACFLVAPTTAAPQRPRTGDTLLGLVDAAARLLDGAHTLPSSQFADVVLWNAERLVQCALLVLGSGDGTVVPVSIACVPPPAPRLREPVEDVRASDAQVLRVLRRTSQQRLNIVKAAIVGHQETLRKRYTEAVNDKELTALLARSKRIDQENLKSEIGQIAGIDKSVVACPDPHLEGVGLEGAMGSMSLSTDARTFYGPDPVEGDGKSGEEGKEAQTVPDVVKYKIRSEITNELALSYDASAEKNRVMELVKANRAERITEAVDVVRNNLEAIEDATIAELKATDTWAEAPSAQQVEKAAELIGRVRVAYKETVEYERMAPEKERKVVEVQEAEAARLRQQNVGAFYAAAALAGAMLKGLLGEGAAPRLHVRPDGHDGASAEVPQWARNPSSSDVKGCVSVAEAALLFDRVVSNDV